jgi:hypothetical protein
VVGHHRGPAVPEIEAVLEGPSVAPHARIGGNADRAQGAEDLVMRLDAVLPRAKHAHPIFGVRGPHDFLQRFLEPAQQILGAFRQVVQARAPHVPGSRAGDRIDGGRILGQPFGMEVQLNVVAARTRPANLIFEAGGHVGIGLAQVENLAHLDEEGDRSAAPLRRVHQGVGGLQDRLRPVDALAFRHRLPGLVVDRQHHVAHPAASHEGGMLALQRPAEQDGVETGEEALERVGSEIAPARRPGGQEDDPAGGQELAHAAQEPFGLDRSEIGDDVARDDQVVAERPEIQLVQAADVPLEEADPGMRGARLRDGYLGKLHARRRARQRREPGREGPFAAPEIEDAAEARRGRVTPDPFQVGAVAVGLGVPDRPGILFAAVELLEVASHDHGWNPADARISRTSDRLRISASAQCPRMRCFHRARWRMSTTP